MISIAAWPGLFGEAEDWEPFFSALSQRVRFLRGSTEGICDVAIGYSMGGRPALAHAATGGVRRALILVSSQPGIEDAKLREERRLADQALAAKLRNWKGDPTGFFQQWWAQEVFCSHRWKPDFWECLLRRRKQAAFPDAIRQLEQWGLGVVNFWPELEALSLPVLAVAGSLDPKYCRIAQEIARRAKHGRCRVLPGQAHMLPLEAPEALAGIVGNFLAEILRPSAYAQEQ